MIVLRNQLERQRISQQIKEIFEKSEAIITDDHFVYAKKADGWYHGSAYVNKDAIYPYTRFVSFLCREIANHFSGKGIQVVIGPTIGGVSLSQWTVHWLMPELEKEFLGVYMEDIDHDHDYDFIKSQGEILAVYADEEDTLEEFSIDVIALKDWRLGQKIEFLVAGHVQIELVGNKGGKMIEKIIYQTKVGTRRVLKRGYDKLVKGKDCLIVEDIINSGATVQKTKQAIRDAGGNVVEVGTFCNRSGGKVTTQTLGVSELFSLLDLDMEMYPEDKCPICRAKGSRSVRTDLGKGREFLIRKGLMIL